MKRNEFLDKLKVSLWALPEADRQCSLDYYSEMIDDRMEDGLSEEEAVAAVGNLEEIVKQILTESPRPPQVVESAKNKQSQQPARDNTKTWLIILLIVGSPVWIPVAAGLLSAVLSVYLSLWAVVISLYAVFVALAASSLGCILAGFFMIGGTEEVIVALGAAALCAGLSILILLLANLAAKGLVKLTKLVWNSVFRRKERKA